MHTYNWCTNHDKPHASQCPDPVEFKALKDAWANHPQNTFKPKEKHARANTAFAFAAVPLVTDNDTTHRQYFALVGHQ